MEQEDSGSFWAEIKKYEDILAKDPASYSFSHLADLYRKIGLTDDAIALSEKGIGLHPDYVGGYVALGRACFDKGLKERSREALEKVVKVTPENIGAQKILSQLYMEMDEPGLAEKSLRIILSMNPSDEESRLSLEAISLRAVAGEEAAIVSAEPVTQPGEEEILDDVELLEAELIDDFTTPSVDPEPEPPVDPGPELGEVLSAAPAPAIFPNDSMDIISGRDPLTTVTLAEIYVSQGFLKRALTIYRDLLHADPENREIRERLFDLKKRIDEDNARARNDFHEDEDAGGAFDEVADEDPAPAFEPVAEIPSPAFASEDAAPPLSDLLSAASDPVTVLEKWLDNIRRRRSCH
jgi:tetratricopeptide (TPR) repeat protein